MKQEFTVNFNNINHHRLSYLKKEEEEEVIVSLMKWEYVNYNDPSVFASFSIKKVVNCKLYVFNSEYLFMSYVSTSSWLVCRTQ